MIVSEHPLIVVQYPTTTEKRTTTAEETLPVVESTTAEETTSVVETTTVGQVTAYVTSMETHTNTGLGKEVRFFLKYLFHIFIRYNLYYSVKSYDYSPELVTIAYMVFCVLVLL